uniref:Uncharacterized protein n=1 Tax=viral metagenome TaxID=1070528 RepID=A0A6C0F732_9ZZZZ|tara:strand:+ start:2124 stop:2555 length:432 start_codon:yes stop_codon:yes gene_type:complete
MNHAFPDNKQSYVTNWAKQERYAVYTPEKNTVDTKKPKPKHKKKIVVNEYPEIDLTNSVDFSPTESYNSQECIREDLDGCFYTRQEFKDYYGDDSMWEFCHPRRKHVHNIIYDAFDYASTNSLSDIQTKLLVSSLMDNLNKGW